MPDSSSSRLTPLQRELLEAFFERTRSFLLSGGAALAGFYLMWMPAYKPAPQGESPLMR